MGKGTATHKQIKKLNDKTKTRKALDEVQRTPKPTVHGLPVKKKKKVETESKADSSAPGFNHFSGRKKRSRKTSSTKN
jgi:hypothetical protein